MNVEENYKNYGVFIGPCEIQTYLAPPREKWRPGKEYTYYVSYKITGQQESV
jgi:hypothetical protein